MNTTTNEKTIRARWFQATTGTVYAVIVAGCDVAQGVFKTKAPAVKKALRIGGRVEAGAFNSNGDIELTWDSERADAQVEINSRDRMEAARQRIETRRAPGW